MAFPNDVIDRIKKYGLLTVVGIALGVYAFRWFYRHLFEKGGWLDILCDMIFAGCRDVWNYLKLNLFTRATTQPTPVQDPTPSAETIPLLVQDPQVNEIQPMHVNVVSDPQERLMLNDVLNYQQRLADQNQRLADQNQMLFDQNVRLVKTLQEIQAQQLGMNERIQGQGVRQEVELQKSHPKKRWMRCFAADD